jgi:hypothetical protein
MQERLKRIDRDLLRKNPLGIDHEMRKRGISEFASFALALSRIIQLPWRPVEVPPNRLRRHADVSMHDTLKSEDGSEGDSEMMQSVGSLDRSEGDSVEYVQRCWSLRSHPYTASRLMWRKAGFYSSERVYS